MGRSRRAARTTPCRHAQLRPCPRKPSSRPASCRRAWQRARRADSPAPRPGGGTLSPPTFSRVRRDPKVHLDADGFGRQRVVDHHAGRELLVRDQHPLVAAGAQDRVVQPHVLDDAVVALDGHPVTDTDGLRDRQHHAGNEVRERLAGGEADDRGGHDAGREDAGRDPVDAGELRQRDGEADQEDRRVDEAAHEPQAGRRLRGDVPARERAHHPLRAALERVIDRVGEREGEHHRHDRGDPLVVRPPEVVERA